MENALDTRNPQLLLYLVQLRLLFPVLFIFFFLLLLLAFMHALVVRIAHSKGALETLKYGRSI